MNRSSSSRIRKGPHWRVELHTELTGFLNYRYRRVRVEQRGKRTSVREFVFQLDYDYDLEPITPPRRLVRQRGRSLSAEESQAFWERCTGVDPWRFEEAYPCPDHVSPVDLDQAVGIDGRPVAVSTGEEGPACLTLRAELDGEERSRRVLIERYAEPPLTLLQARRPDTPLATLCAMVDVGLKSTQPFNYRRSDSVLDLTAEFAQLKALDFLNLRDFERRAIEALGTLGDPTTVPFLTEALFAPDPLVRLQALDALAWIGDEETASDVELLYYDEDMRVRDRAREVLDLLRGVFSGS